MQRSEVLELFEQLVQAMKKDTGNDKTNEPANQKETREPAKKITEPAKKTFVGPSDRPRLEVREDDAGFVIKCRAAAVELLEEGRVLRVGDFKMFVPQDVSLESVTSTWSNDWVTVVMKRVTVEK